MKNNDLIYGPLPKSEKTVSDLKMVQAALEAVLGVIRARERRIAELEAALKQWEPLEQFGSALEISQDLERLWELLEVDGEPYEGEDSLSSLYGHRMARIPRLEAQIAGYPKALAGAKREALKEAADRMLRDFRGVILFSPIGDSLDAGVEIAKELRRMALEVK